jgi:uncharacterized RDD family membrane protein YckC
LPSVRAPRKTRGPTDPAGAREIALGLAVVGVRAGVAAGRLALTPLRVAARAPFAAPLVGALAADGREARRRARVQAEAAAARVVASPELERTVDRALAAPLTDAAARSVAEHRVVERVAGEVFTTPQFEEALTAALEHQRTRMLVERTLDSDLSAEVTERVLASPEVREALTRQTTSFAEELLARLRGRLRRRDDAMSRGSHAYGGIATRTVAFVADLALAQVVFLLVTASVGLVTSLVGDLPSGWIAGLLVGGGWLVVVGAYLVTFWTLAGQTPGMRALDVRVATRAGTPLSLVRSVVRFAALLLAIAPLFAGFLPILFDRRRRGLHDLLAGTVVITERPALPRAT